MIASLQKHSPIRLATRMPLRSIPRTRIRPFSQSEKAIGLFRRLSSRKTAHGRSMPRQDSRRFSIGESAGTSCGRKRGTAPTSTRRGEKKRPAGGCGGGRGGERAVGGGGAGGGKAAT